MSHSTFCSVDSVMLHVPVPGSHGFGGAVRASLVTMPRMTKLIQNCSYLFAVLVRPPRRGLSFLVAFLYMRLLLIVVGDGVDVGRNVVGRGDVRAGAEDAYDGDVLLDRQVEQ